MTVVQICLLLYFCASLRLFRTHIDAIYKFLALTRGLLCLERMSSELSTSHAVLVQWKRGSHFIDASCSMSMVYLRCGREKSSRLLRVRDCWIDDEVMSGALFCL